MKLYFSLILAAIILVLDLLSKRWVEFNLSYGQQIVITDFFNLVLAYNAGAAFSFLSDASGWQRWFLSTIAALVAVLIVYLLYKHTSNRLFCFALSLILGGALGNLWDRITLGHVVDFMDFHVVGYHWPAFNLADSAIFCGACLLILDSIRNGRNDSVQEG
ncbi:MAG: lipoprotein signal peptidase [Nitrosomonas sp.]|uniref:signal peptidase II n=1 Tax=Nitrosomonas sp. TaxID=42353 RepID=UPI002566B66F|nr:signal peptidase II [Nitrosomonas sp.]MBE7526313.1 lipoprotein signal peptidase [Burkholderiales bacterium]MCC6161154.1 lipoprotein signal peptidase [Nitrosomonas sp.]MDL1866508.1 lipoprotein signal peptidase [Betaproteobacteria bacterium PRO4]